MTQSAIIRSSNEGRRVSVVGDIYRFMATGEETGGKYAAVEAFVPPGGGPPPHRHSREEESFYVLEGVISFQLEGERIEAEAGTFLNMPIGSLHAFKNETSQPARMIITFAPAGFEQMFVEAGRTLADDVQVAPQPTAEDIERLLAVAPKYGVEFLAPH